MWDCLGKSVGHGLEASVLMPEQLCPCSASLEKARGNNPPKELPKKSSITLQVLAQLKRFERLSSALSRLHPGGRFWSIPRDGLVIKSSDTQMALAKCFRS